MPNIVCTIPEGALSVNQILRLEASFQESYAARFGPTKRVNVLWCSLPPGQGFTDGQVSNVSVGLVEVEDGLDQQRRESALFEFAENWAQIAEISLHEVLITLADSTTFSEYLRANRNRVRWQSRPWFLLTTIVHMLKSRKRLGYRSLRANL